MNQLQLMVFALQKVVSKVARLQPDLSGSRPMSRFAHGTAAAGVTALMLVGGPAGALDRVVVEGTSYKPVGGVTYDSISVQEGVLPPGMAGSGGPINSGFDRLVNRNVTQGGGNGRQAPSGCSAGNGGGSNPQSSNPVVLASGAKTLEQSDFFHQSLVPLQSTRRYQSDKTGPGTMFGPGWQSGYEIGVGGYWSCGNGVCTASYLNIELPDGSVYNLTYTSPPRGGAGNLNTTMSGNSVH